MLAIGHKQSKCCFSKDGCAPESPAPDLRRNHKTQKLGYSTRQHHEKAQMRGLRLFEPHGSVAAAWRQSAMGASRVSTVRHLASRFLEYPRVATLCVRRCALRFQPSNARQRYAAVTKRLK